MSIVEEQHIVLMDSLSRFWHWGTGHGPHSSHRADARHSCSSICHFRIHRREGESSICEARWGDEQSTCWAEQRKVQDLEEHARLGNRCPPRWRRMKKSYSSDSTFHHKHYIFVLVYSSSFISVTHRDRDREMTFVYDDSFYSALTFIAHDILKPYLSPLILLSSPINMCCCYFVFYSVLRPLRPNARSSSSNSHVHSHDTNANEEGIE